MSGARPTHLQRSGGTYHLPVRVPDDIRAQIGVLEVVRSLRVHTFPRARLLALKYAARLMEVFVVVRESRLSKGQARGLVTACFGDLARDAERGFIPTSSHPDEVGFQRFASHERITELQDEVAAGVFSGDVREAARRLVVPYGVELKTCTEDVQLDVINGVARALIEQRRLFM